MDSVENVGLIDGYVDEPTVLGVPPYVSIYPRYVAGSIWTNSPKTQVHYQTIDQIRKSFENAQRQWSKMDLLILIAGMIVPGKYIGGTPISVREARILFSSPLLEDIPKILVGPWASFGCGIQGGKVALSSEVLAPPFDYIIKGDAEIVLAQVFDPSIGLESANLETTRESASEIEPYTIKGAQIVTQHPGFSNKYIICEIETYRGCPRFLTGGCSFCVEPSYGIPQQRKVNDIVKEIESLHKLGVGAFRLGHQADLFTYGSQEIGEYEFPTPNVNAIDELFSKIRNVAPDLDVLHIDNVNPGTIARHPEESKKVAKAIMKYHTAGDVAAFGVESTDPEVIRRNNLKGDVDEMIEAVRIMNEVGGKRESRGLPHLLPGINLLYGLPGESKKTLEHNMNFLEQILDEGLILRRINVRQVIGLHGTNLEPTSGKGIKRNQFFKHKQEIRDHIDVAMIKRVAPPGTILQSVFLDVEDGNSYLLRQLGTYPLLCHMAKDTSGLIPKDVFVVDHGPRSLTVLPHPFRPQQASLSQWKSIPGIGSKRATRIRAAGNPHSVNDISMVLDMDIPEWLSQSLSFD
ncbi:MAG: radical SAM protein [Candidatus Thorarchaeota archaeon]|nr:MAG: radical SAM protein [Candidatus Thorarchaeota archaeon]